MFFLKDVETFAKVSNVDNIKICLQLFEFAAGNILQIPLNDQLTTNYFVFHMMTHKRLLILFKLFALFEQT